MLLQASKCKREASEERGVCLGRNAKKNNVCGQAVVFSASSPSRLSGASHSLRACLRSPAKTRKKGGFGQKAGFSSIKIGRQKRVKEAMPG